MNIIETDVLIIGSGIAGMMAAECLSQDKQVTMITKSGWDESNSMRAQGGIAAAISKEDHWTGHLLDTMVAGVYHNDEQAAKLLVRQGPSLVRKLIEFGVPFDRDDQGRLQMGMEGAHGARRILHAGGDATGCAIMKALATRVRPKIVLRESETLVDVSITDGRCIGAVTRNNDGEWTVYKAAHTILATGGVGGLYQVSSNDPTITGDGMAAAYRAGISLADMEFVQFHPTMLTVCGQSGGLVSEAVRGEGARLVTDSGQRVMEGLHPKMDLAPRDIVARALHSKIISGEKVFLDISMISNFERRFPTVTANCENLGVNVQEKRIPVAPGMHFMMGGIVTDLQGRTEMARLYAIGETACTGAHGANRLASNSLLEGIVFAAQAARAILTEGSAMPSDTIRLPSYCGNQSLFIPGSHEIKERMTEYVGIERDQQGLLKAKSWFEHHLTFEKENFLHRPISEIKHLNMLTVGWLIATSALLRTESRGGHYRKDFTVSNERKWGKRRIIRRKTDEQAEIGKVAPSIF